MSEKIRMQSQGPMGRVVIAFMIEDEHSGRRVI